jgi:hypothetical protein
MKKKTKTILIFGGVAVVGYFILRSRGMLGAFCNAKYQQNWQSHKYNASDVAKAVRAGADTYAQWYSGLSSQERAWVNTLSQSVRLQAYFAGYIEPWLHGLYGGPGNSAVHQTKVKPYSTHAPCGQWLPPSLRRNEWRGEHQGICGEG